MPSKYDEQIREKAVRLVRDHAEDYPTEWAGHRQLDGGSVRLGHVRTWGRWSEPGAV